MAYQLSGLRDKLYWRPAGQWCADIFHCFKKLEGPTRGGKNVFVSLCGRYERVGSGGQACARPPAIRRCPICDGKEMDRRGWEYSGPERPEWRDFLLAEHNAHRLSS